MNDKFKPLLVSLSAGILIVSIILTLIALGPTSIVPWLLMAALLIIPLYYSLSDKKQFVTWKEQYSVGIPEIDDDHQKLLNLINQLQAAVIYKTGEQFEKEALDEVIAYTKYHFQKEEGMMRDANYTDLDAHIKQHEDMIVRVNLFLKEYEINRFETIKQLSEFLKNWLINHIDGSDQKYSKTVKMHLERGE